MGRSKTVLRNILNFQTKFQTSKETSPKFIKDRKFKRPQENLNCEHVTYKVAT